MTWPSAAEKSIRGSGADVPVAAPAALSTLPVAVSAVLFTAPVAWSAPLFTVLLAVPGRGQQESEFGWIQDIPAVFCAVDAGFAGVALLV